MITTQILLRGGSQRCRSGCLIRAKPVQMPYLLANKTRSRLGPAAIPRRTRTALPIASRLGRLTGPREDHRLGSIRSHPHCLKQHIHVLKNAVLFYTYNFSVYLRRYKEVRMSETLPGLLHGRPAAFSFLLLLPPKHLGKVLIL